MNSMPKVVPLDRRSPTLIVVDDDPGICDLIQTVAEGVGFVVSPVNSHDAFKRIFTQVKPDLLVVDLAMPDGDGIELLRYLGQNECTCPVAVISGFDAKVVNAAVRLGKTLGLRMVASLTKPFDLAHLTQLLQAAAGERFAPEEAELKRALDAGEIIPFYQPIFDLSLSTTSSPVGLEALARWRHPTRGLMGPDTFIALAESVNLIEPITNHMLTESAKHLAVWKKAGYDFTVAVNFPPILLTALDYPDRIVDILRAEGIEPSRLTLEITERQAIENTSMAMDILTRLRLKGVEIALDDFGTGYSSLIHLYRMPFSKLKIDRSFVTDMVSSEEASTIVRASIDLAHNLGLAVCAEGVETGEVLDLVADKGCDLAQGFLLGRPMPADSIMDIVAASAARNDRK